MTGPVLVADCIAKRFDGRPVLTAATLRVQAGVVTALVGRNGSGKSTLLRIAAGLISADSGAVHYLGAVYERPFLPRLARRGLFLLADRDMLSTSFTIQTQLAFMARRFRARERVEDVVIEAADAAGILGRLNARPWQLSGGEYRRAELAMAFARRPVCLLADEPFRGIAPLDAEALSALFRRIAALGCAVCVTGHEVWTLLGVADRVTWCTDGTTYELGTPAHAQRDDRFRAGYLGRI